MKQVILDIHLGGWHIPIYGYGLMLVIGFLAAAHWAKYLAKRSGLDGEVFINAALVALVTGIIGARVSHILENLGDFTRADRTVGENLLNMINLRSGGLTYYGGFLLAFPTLVGYLIWKKLPLRASMDIAAPCLMVALGFGRVGCFMNGCCYGAECDLPWAIQFPYDSPPYVDQFLKGQVKPDPRLLEDANGRLQLRDVEDIEKDPQLRALARSEWSKPVHPAQFYSTFTSFLIAGITFAYLTLRRAPGRAAAWMLILEGGSRFLLEMVRAEPAVVGPMSLSMIIGLGLMVLGIGLWFVFGKLSSEGPAVRAAVAAART
ncbi:MAG: prolipoprotein diacylglyceryl transferase [Bacillota bacterium]